MSLYLYQQSKKPSGCTSSLTVVCYAEHGILPDEEIVVVNTHVHDDDDLGSFFGQTSSTKPQEERGFTGTALFSHGAIAGLQ